MPGCTARRGDAADALFPVLAGWHATRTRGDDWVVRDLSHEIVEYGDVDHEGCAIRAIVLLIDFDFASPGRGARQRECHVIAAAWDGEFARWRTPLSAPCDDGGTARSWSRGYALTSLWTASDAELAAR